MNPGQFLRYVWPTQGFYCIAHPFKVPNTNRTSYTHHVYPTIAEAVTHAYEKEPTKDVFFAVLSLAEARVWNPEKEDWRTGENGAWETRSQANSMNAKCVFFDLDVGTEDNKYDSQAEARAGLEAFVAATKLPVPLMVSSGGGIHCYWVWDSEIPVDQFREIALHMKQLAIAHGLKIDPSRTTDSSSVLRVSGTRNHKNPDQPRPVVVLEQGVITPVGMFKTMVRDALIAEAVVPGVPKARYAPDPVSELGQQKFADEWDKPSLQELGDACGQVRELVRTQSVPKGNPAFVQLENPQWYKGLICTVAHIEDGDRWAHTLTDPNPRDVADTDNKLAQARQYPPASCASLQTMPWGDKPCQGCAFRDKVKNPFMAARRTTIAPAPGTISLLPSAGAAPSPNSIPPLPAGAGTLLVPPALAALASPSAIAMTVLIPQPPAPWKRLKAGGISLMRKDKDGNETPTLVYENDLYPLKRLVNPETGTEQLLWRVVLPRTGDKDFLLDADALYDLRKFTHAISNAGVYPHKADVSALQDYMVAYITQLQKDLDADTQISHLGWIEDGSSFLMPDLVYHPDGSVTPTSLTRGAQKASQFVRRSGSEVSQIALLSFFDHDEYMPNQFVMLCSLGSIFYGDTGNHGILVNMSGASGASKTTTLQAAAGVWGDTVQWPLNGTSRGATANLRAQRVTTNNNLPTMVDEITHMAPKDATELAMNITQPGQRLRLGVDGQEKAVSESHKAAIMITSANTSLHNLLSVDNAAGTAASMRVFELHFTPQRVHTKAEADDFKRGIAEHYGHLGPQFVKFVVKHREAVRARVVKIMREIDIEANIQSSERFWSAAIACALVAGEICNALGLLAYDVAKLRAWALTVQIPHMRGVVKEEYRDSLAVMQDYIAEKHGSIVTINAGGTGANISSHAAPGEAFPVNHVHGALLGHHDVNAGVLYLLKQGFKDHCNRSGASMNRILDELATPRVLPNEPPRKIITDKSIRRTLGAGTSLAKGQSWCFAIDLTHPAMGGAFAVVLTQSGGVQTSPPTGQLKAVP
jgi:hypothetical protein